MDCRSRWLPERVERKIRERQVVAKKAGFKDAETTGNEGEEIDFPMILILFRSYSSYE